METVLVLSVLITLVLSGPVPGSDNAANRIDTKEFLFLGYDETNVTYWFFSKENPTNGIPVTKETVSILDDTSFSTTRDTIFIVHGWRNANDSDFIITVRDAVVSNLDVNVFVNDWSEIANQDYISARYSVSTVGGYLADFINSLISTYRLSLSSTTLVGHSLGAHVVGTAGAALDGQVAVIVGLDPALPLFMTSSSEERLDASDAEFVHVIHTNGGFKGFLSPLGHSDYYPNGGASQPGCGTDLTGSCAHARAYVYYAESLAGGTFKGVSCGSYLQFSLGGCSTAGTSLMGGYPVDTSATGSYYLNTNSGSPYAQG